MAKDKTEGTTEKESKKEAAKKASSKKLPAEKSAGENLPAEKKTKPPKLYPAKKLPKLLKKAYRADKIEKQLFKKIYISSDKAMLKSLFEENPEKPGTLKIPADKMIEKLDFKRLKLIAKDVKKNRGSFKLLPFIATVIFIAAVILAFITFKNPLAKKGIQMGMQKIFGARTDIGRVNVEFLNATITINDLQQANANSPMKNIFQIDKTEIHFNLTEALRGKFDAENIEVTGLQIGTARTYSGELPDVVKTENPMVEKVKAMVAEKKDEAVYAAKDSIERAFAEYNPENMIKNVQDNLKSPEVAKEVQKQVEASIEKWKNKPDEIEKEVKNFSDSVQSLVEKDWSSVTNPLEIKNAVTQVTDALNKSKSVSDNIKTVVQDIKDDSNSVKNISLQIQDAIKSDTALVETQLNKITSFNIDTGTQILSNAFYSALYAVCGEYYPYVEQAIEAALKAKASASASDKEKQKEAAKNQTRHQRLPGIDIWWKNDNVPRFLIEKISFSGLGVTANGIEISNDMDKRGSPATITASYQEGTRRTHKANIVVDARSNTKNPLVGAHYTGNNYPLAFKSPYLNMDSNTGITANLSMTESGAVKIGANLDLGSLLLTADEFEPAIAYRFYSEALEAVKTLQLATTISIDENRKFSLSIDSDLDKQFNTILKSVVNKELKTLIGEASTQIKSLLSEQTGGITDRISEFVNIENGINAQSLNMDKLNQELKSRSEELKKMLEEEASSAASDALKSTGLDENTSNILGGALKGLFGN